MALKCADLGHLASAEGVHLKWVGLLEEEMFRQGDKEKARGYPVSPLMDRDKEGITRSQPGVSTAPCIYCSSQFRQWESPVLLHIRSALYVHSSST